MGNEFVNVISQLAFKEKMYAQNQEAIKAAQKQQSALKLEIEKIKQPINKELNFSDHAVLRFIEHLQCLPINMSSNANQDYIEMGDSIYKMAIQFFNKELLNDT